MITETTAISCAAWAILVTPVGIAACALSEHQRCWKNYWYKEACSSLDLAQKAIDDRDIAQERAHRSALNLLDVRDRAIDAEDRLVRIEHQRHNSAKKARAAQLAQQAAAREARTRELQQNIADRSALPAPDWMQAA